MPNQFHNLTGLSHLLSLPVLASMLTLAVHGAVIDSATIERVTGLKGTMNTNEGVFKVTAPRNDLQISVDGWTMPPFMGLTSWAAFSEGKQAEAMVMGDLVFLRNESGGIQKKFTSQPLNDRRLPGLKGATPFQKQQASGPVNPRCLAYGKERARRALKEIGLSASGFCSRSNPSPGTKISKPVFG